MPAYTDGVDDPDGEGRPRSTHRTTSAGDRTRRPLPSRAARFSSQARADADQLRQRNGGARSWRRDSAAWLDRVARPPRESRGVARASRIVVGKTETEAVDRVAAGSVPKESGSSGGDGTRRRRRTTPTCGSSAAHPIIRCCCMACTRSRRGETAWRSSARASRRRRQILPAEKSGKTSADSPPDPVEQRHAARRARDPPSDRCAGRSTRRRGARCTGRGRLRLRAGCRRGARS